MDSFFFPPEGPLELLLRGAGAGDIDGKQKLLEVDVSVLVGVEGAEDVVAELLSVARREKHLVHVDKLDRRQSAVRAVLLEALVPLLDGVLVVASLRLQKLQVLLGQALLALDAAHLESAATDRRLEQHWSREHSQSDRRLCC